MSTDGQGNGQPPVRRLARRLRAAAGDTWTAAAEVMRSRMASATAPPGVMAASTTLTEVSLSAIIEPVRQETAASVAAPGPYRDQAGGAARTGATATGPWPRTVGPADGPDQVTAAPE